MKRRSLWLSAGVFVALAVAVTAVGLAVRKGHGGVQRGGPAGAATGSESQLASANYKVLTPTRTRALLRYADAAYACLSKEIDIGKPRPTKTKIVMALPAGSPPSAVVRAAVSCSAKIGDPPRDASFQVRGRNVILYLPRYCILDKKVVTATDAGPRSP